LSKLINIEINGKHVGNVLVRQEVHWLPLYQTATSVLRLIWIEWRTEREDQCNVWTEWEHYHCLANQIDRRI
jgi:hypothetical protein